MSTAMALAACGPRDAAPLAAGAAVAAAPTPQSPAAVAPAPLSQNDAARVGSPVPIQLPAVTANATAPAYAAPPPVVVAQQPDGPVLRPARPVAQAPAVTRDRVGSIVAIDPIRTRPQGSGAGAVVGGVLGGVIGNQFGHGLGRAAMTGVGAAGGAIAGNNVERNYKEGVAGYRVHIRLDNGNTRTFERDSIGNLHVGDRVRLDAHGFRRG